MGYHIRVTVEGGPTLMAFDESDFVMEFTWE